MIVPDLIQIDIHKVNIDKVRFFWWKIAQVRHSYVNVESRSSFKESEVIKFDFHYAGASTSLWTWVWNSACCKFLRSRTICNVSSKRGMSAPKTPCLVNGCHLVGIGIHRCFRKEVPWRFENLVCSGRSYLLSYRISSLSKLNPTLSCRSPQRLRMLPLRKVPNCWTWAFQVFALTFSYHYSKSTVNQKLQRNTLPLLEQSHWSECTTHNAAAIYLDVPPGIVKPKVVSCSCKHPLNILEMLGSKIR